MKPAPRTITETKDALAFGVALFSTISAAMGDGKIGATDIPRLLSLYKPVKAAIEGAREIPAELLDIDDAEMDEICALIGDHLNVTITGAVARETANKTLNTLRSVVDLIAHIRGVNPPKAVPV